MYSSSTSQAVGMVEAREMIGHSYRMVHGSMVLPAISAIQKKEVSGLTTIGGYRMTSIPKALSPGEEEFALQCRAYNLNPQREYKFCERGFRFDFAWPHI